MLRIRLTRRGAKKNPHYRVVVTEKSSPRDGRFKEIVGHYNPALEPVQLQLDLERVDHWIENGAQPTRTVKTLIRRVRAQGQAEEVPLEKVVEKKSQAKPEKVVEEEPPAEPEKAAESKPQEKPDEVKEETPEEASQEEPEEVTEETSQEEPEEATKKASPDEA